jgi:hypothetical protein
MGSHRIQIPFCVQPKMDDQQGFFHGGSRREQDGFRSATLGGALALPAINDRVRNGRGFVSAMDHLEGMKVIPTLGENKESLC